MDMATALAELGVTEASLDVETRENKGPMFDVCFTDPRVLACIAHVLGDFKLSSLNFRAEEPQ